MHPCIPFIFAFLASLLYCLIKPMCIFIQEIKANQAALTEPEIPLNDMSFNIKPLNLQGGQW